MRSSKDSNAAAANDNLLLPMSPQQSVMSGEEIGDFVRMTVAE